jgi:hypothetical protein
MARIVDFSNIIEPTESAVFVLVDNNDTRKITLGNLRTSLFRQASTTEFGTIKVGNNLVVDENGFLNASDAPITDWNATSGLARILNKPSLATVATSGLYSDLSNKPVIPSAQIPADWEQTDELQRDFIRNKPVIPAAQQASDWAESNTSSITFIKNKPVIPAAQQASDWDAVSGVTQILNKPVLFSGNYSDLTNKPALAPIALSGQYADLSGTPPIPTTEYIEDAPVDSIGQPGDVPGMIFADPLYIYVCYAIYDGVSNIWAKSETVGDTW